MKKKKIIILLISILSLLQSGCSTLDHHKIGKPYSGVEATKSKKRTYYGPNGPIGVGALFTPIVSFGYTFIYFPIDFVFSAVADTLLLPVDLVQSDSYKKKVKIEDAIQRRDIDFAIKMYKTGEYTNKYPLIESIVQGEDCSRIKRYSLQIDLVDDFEFTPLDYALKTGHTQCLPMLATQSNFSHLDISNIPSARAMRILLELGFPINIYDKRYKSTPLLKVIKKSNNSIALELIKQGADTSIQDVRGFDALMYAVETNNTVVFNALLDRNTSVDRHSKSKETPLMIAIKRGQKEMAQKLIERSNDLNTLNFLKFSALDYAIIFNDRKTFDNLMRHKVDINHQNAWELTPLMVALDRKDLVQNIELLKPFEIDRSRTLSDAFTSYREYRAYVNRNTIHYDRSLYTSSREYFAKALLRNKADIHKKSSYKGNILFFAIQEDVNGTITRYCVEHGVDINEKRPDGKTLLYTLVEEKESIAKIKKVIDLGANVNAGDSDGYTPLMLAKEKNITEVIDLLTAKGGIDYDCY